GAATAKSDGSFDCPGPIITGIFPKETIFRKRHDQTLSVRYEEQVAIDEAIELFLLLKPLGIEPSEIRYDSVRGFSSVAVLSGEAGEHTVIALGRAPFSAKLSKLRNIRQE